MLNKKFTLSIVSHGHSEFVRKLLNDLLKIENIYRIIITINIKSEKIEYPSEMESKIITIVNPYPKGFSVNHNYAFQEYCKSDYFCVLNPDIRITENPFPRLISFMDSSGCAITAPMVKDEDGNIQDSARYFPTPFSLLFKAFGHDTTVFPSLSPTGGVSHPNWVAGMFMFIKSSWFSKNKFDENFFLYYEDIDLCLRCWKSKNKVAFIKDIYVYHNARRDSHRKLYFFFLHIRSILYFFFKNYLRYPKFKK